MTVSLLTPPLYPHLAPFSPPYGPGGLLRRRQSPRPCAADGLDPTLRLDELVTAASKIKSRLELRAAIHSVAKLTATREGLPFRQAAAAKSKPDPEATGQKILNWRIPERKAEHAVRMKPLVEAKKQFPGRTYEIPLTMEPMLPTVRRSPTDEFLR